MRSPHLVLSVILMNALLFILAPRNTAYAADCFTSGIDEGNKTVSTTCDTTNALNATVSISSLETPASKAAGVDSTTTANTAVLTVGNGTTLTVMANTALVVGSINLNSTGAIVIQPNAEILLGAGGWMADSDSDGIPDSSTLSVARTNPGTDVKRVELTDPTVVDCAPSSSSYGKVITGNAPVYQFYLNESSVGSYGLAKEFASGYNAQNYYWAGNTTAAYNTTQPTGSIHTYSRSFNGSTSLLGFENAAIKNIPLTLEAWVRVPSAPSATATVIATDSQSPTYYGAWLQIGTDLSISIHYGDGTGAGAGDRYSKTSAASAISTNTWVHIAGTITNTSTFNLYVNGTDVGGSYSGTQGVTFSSPNSYGSIGGRIMRYPGSGTNSGFLNGYLSDVRIYNYARSQTQIVEDMNWYSFNNTLYQGDSDGDWVATTATSTTSCMPVSGYGSRQSDPSDSDAQVFRTGTCYQDADGDGFKNTTGSSSVNLGYGCNMSASATYRTENGTVDCNDSAYSLANLCCWTYGGACDAGCDIYNCIQDNNSNQTCGTPSTCSTGANVTYQMCSSVCSSTGSGNCNKTLTSGYNCFSCTVTGTPPYEVCNLGTCATRPYTIGACTWSN